MFVRSIFALLTSLLMLQACGGGSSSDGSQLGNESLAEPRITDSTYEGRDITIEWESSGDGAQDGTFNIYYAEEPISDTDNYSTFEGGQLLQNVESPQTITVPSLRPVYHFRVSQIKNGIESSPSAEARVIPRYEIVSNGSQVIDRVNEILWDRCVYGQSWDTAAASCVGTQQLVTLDEAKTAARAKGMSVPNTRDLLSLTFCSSRNPSYFPRDKYLLSNEMGGLNNPNYTSCAIGTETPSILQSMFPEVHPTLVQIVNYPCSDGYSGNDFVTFNLGKVNVCGSAGIEAYVRFADDLL